MTGQDRAQTPLDFAIAMGIFLLAVTFVFTFIPSLTAPFVEGNQDKTVTADRVASHLAEGGLGDPAEPFVVNDSCAEVFFNKSNTIPSYCGYSDNGNGDYNLSERVGVDTDRLQVNVTIEQVNTTATRDDRFDRFRTVCTRADGGAIIHEEVSGTSCGGAEFMVGDEPTDDDSVVVARRIVTIPDCQFGSDVESCDVTLKVRVW